MQPVLPCVTRAPAQLLGKRFSTPSSRRPCLVLLADEIDYLVTRKQTVLYNLFEWPTRRGCRLVVVGIANTMDLPERLLPRVASRLGMGRIVFQPYTREQIQTIVKASAPPRPAAAGRHRRRTRGSVRALMHVSRAVSAARPVCV